MKDSDVFNFDLSSEPKIDLRERLRHMWSSLERWRAIEDERSKDPRWQLKPIHVMTPDMWEIVASPDTPPEVKHMIMLATYQGQQWVYNDDRSVNDEEKVRDERR